MLFKYFKISIKLTDSSEAYQQESYFKAFHCKE